MSRRAMQTGVGLTLCLSLVLSMLSGASGSAKKAAKIKKVAVTTTDSGVLVMKKKERRTLKLALNGKSSKKAWKQVKFRSKNKKIVKVDNKGKLTAKKKGTTKITISAKKGKAKTTLKVIVGTKIKSIRMNAAAQMLTVGNSMLLTAAITPKKASYRELRWTSSDPGVAVVKNGNVTAVKEGTAVITAAAMDGTKKKAVCRITVKKGDGNQTPGPGINTSPIPGASANPTPTQGSNTPSITDGPDHSTQEPTNKPTNTPTAGETDPPSGSQEPVATATNQPTATNEPTPIPTVPTVTPRPTGTSTPIPTATPELESVLKMNCNKMTTTGPYAGAMSEPFAGVKLYGNGDGVKTSYSFEGTNKKYRIILKGASTNNSAAGVSLYIGDKKKGAVSFTGEDLQEQVIDFKMQDDETGTLDIFFKLETDNGSNDTCLQSFELIFLGDIPEPPAAPVPVGGAAYTGNYRNMFKELGHTEEEINAKVENAWQKFFYGTEDERIYYPVEPDMAYIYTADTNDVRSEGMSYGMMICVQMDKQEEFDRLWKWAKTYMQHTSGEFKDYFAWKCQTSGSKMENTPASDGEEYFVTALLFASARWGDGEGIYDYNGEAQKLLNALYYHDNGSVTVNSIFNAEHKMPVFCPIGSAMNYTDPSYHLPAFYEVWALTAEEHSEFWVEAAEASRQHFKDATNETTGLGPDYSNYDGTPTGGNHADFRFDAWRIAGNIACDYAWWGKDNWATTHANRIQGFFAEKGVEEYGNQWSLDGKELDSDHSPGLVAMNATASLAASDKNAWAFLENFWNISPTTGKYRYYDGCLYMMGLLHCSGKFRAYLPNGTKPAVSSTIAADSYEFDKEETKQSPIRVTMTLNGNTLTQIQNAGVALTLNKDYTMQGDVVTISKEYLASLETGNVSLSFVFSAGRKATLSLKIKDTTQGVIPEPSSPFEQISAAAFTDSHDVTVEEGIVTFNSTDSWIAFDLDFGTDAVQNGIVYVKEPNNSGQVYVCMDSVSKQVGTIYNLGNGSWKETQNNCSITSGQHMIYVKVNKAGVQMQWIKFTKK